MENKDLLEILEKIKEDQVEIKITLAKNTASLEAHMMRTDLLEKRQDKDRQDLTSMLSNIADRLKPVESHIAFLNNTVKLVVAVGATLVFLQKIGLLTKIVSFFVN